MRLNDLDAWTDAGKTRGEISVDQELGPVYRPLSKVPIEVFVDEPYPSTWWEQTKGWLELIGWIVVVLFWLAVLSLADNPQLLEVFLG